MAIEWRGVWTRRGKIKGQMFHSDWNHNYNYLTNFPSQLKHATSANEKLQAPFFHLSAVFLSKVQSIVTICCNAVSFLCLLFTTAMKNIRRAAASKKLCNKTDFYRQPDVLCGTSETSSCRYFQNSSMQNMFCSFLTIFLAHIYVGVRTNMQILRGTKWIHSFLFEKDNPSCFLFSVIFVGMRVVEHFSRSKMQIQLGIALKTGRVLKQNPWKAAKFSLSLVQRRTWPTQYPPPSSCIVQEWAQKTLHKGICATSKDFANNPTAKASIKS